MTKDTSKEVAVLEKEITRALPPPQFSIKTPDDMKWATEQLSQLNRYADTVKNRKEEITKPLNAALKSARALFSTVEAKLDTGIATLRSAMGAYQLEAEQAAQRKEEKIAARVGEGKGFLKPETAVRKMEGLEKPQTSIQTDSGSVKFRDVKKFEVMDVTMLPHEYVLPNESLIRKATAEGIELQGVRYWIEKIVVNSR